MPTICEVNGRPIDAESLRRVSQRFQHQDTEDTTNPAANAPSAAERRYAHVEALRYLIDRELLLQLAESEGIEVEPAEADRRLQELRANYADDEAWKQQLEDMGVTADTLAHELMDDLIIESVLEHRLAQMVDITEEELQAYYQMHETWMKEADCFSFYELILDEQANLTWVGQQLQAANHPARLEQIFTQAGIAFSFSEGVVGSSIPEALLRMLSDLAPGQVASMPLEDGKTLLVQLVSRQTGKHLSFSDMKEDLRRYLAAQAQKTLAEELCAELFCEADIVYLDEAVRASIRA